MTRRPLRAGLSVLAALSATAPLAAQDNIASGQRVSFTEAKVEVYDAVGTVTLRRVSGNAVTITATAVGADGSQLTFAADRESGRARFRVVFPDVDQIAGAQIGRAHV